MRRNNVELYETMAKAIEYLRAHTKEQPGAAEVAKAIGMSQSRFEHAFAAWVGTTPKRFLAYLTKQHAKELLRASQSVTHATLRAGLSSTGRLHDLLVTYEAVSPGELKKGDIDITYGIHASPFGWCVIATTSRGICEIGFLEKNTDKSARTRIYKEWPRAKLTRDDARTKKIAEQIFLGSNKPMHLLVRGTNFQIKVWEALLSIPYGQVSTYGEIAKKIGSPRAVRAVGAACGKNHIPYLIPCHRVLASDGGIGGYSGGITRKQAMLMREATKEAKGP